jgi:hypothetical protein
VSLGSCESGSNPRKCWEELPACLALQSQATEVASTADIRVAAGFVCLANCEQEPTISSFLVPKAPETVYTCRKVARLDLRICLKSRCRWGNLAVCTVCKDGSAYHSIARMHQVPTHAGNAALFPRYDIATCCHTKYPETHLPRTRWTSGPELSLGLTSLISKGIIKEHLSGNAMRMWKWCMKGVKGKVYTSPRVLHDTGVQLVVIGINLHGDP